MNLGEILQELRLDRGLTLKELGVLINKCPSTISNYEHNLHQPDIDTLNVLADFFDVSVDYLLQRTKLKCSINDINKSLTDNFTVADLMNTVIELHSETAEHLIPIIRALHKSC